MRFNIGGRNREIKGEGGEKTKGSYREISCYMVNVLGHRTGTLMKGLVKQ